jgi:hypothetical protein
MSLTALASLFGLGTKALSIMGRRESGSDGGGTVKNE